MIICKYLQKLISANSFILFDLQSKDLSIHRYIELTKEPTLKIKLKYEIIKL